MGMRLVVIQGDLPPASDARHRSRSTTRPSGPALGDSRPGRSVREQTHDDVMAHVVTSRLAAGVLRAKLRGAGGGTRPEALRRPGQPADEVAAAVDLLLPLP